MSGLYGWSMGGCLGVQGMVNRVYLDVSSFLGQVRLAWALL